MPIYEYECQKCQLRFERLQKLSDPPATKCPKCGGKVSQLLSAPAVQFKGTGWYVTDYARKSGAPSGDGKKAEAKAESKTETTKSESKPAKKDKKNT
ncbi:MAG: FmdB family zinc ribbon protein [Terriglobales bacterium]